MFGWIHHRVTFSASLESRIGLRNTSQRESIECVPLYPSCLSCPGFHVYFYEIVPLFLLLHLYCVHTRVFVCLCEGGRVRAWERDSIILFSIPSPSFLISTFLFCLSARFHLSSSLFPISLHGGSSWATPPPQFPLFHHVREMRFFLKARTPRDLSATEDWMRRGAWWSWFSHSNGVHNELLTEGNLTSSPALLLLQVFVTGDRALIFHVFIESLKRWSDFNCFQMNWPCCDY